jgi:hypothetical protein
MVPARHLDFKWLMDNIVMLWTVRQGYIHDGSLFQHRYLTNYSQIRLATLSTVRQYLRVYLTILLASQQHVLTQLLSVISNRRLRT